MAKDKGGTAALAKWDEELAREAEAAAKMEENSGGGQFFSVKAGVLTFNDAPVPGNEMAVVIVDHILENVYYEGEYDAENRAGPSCFAFGRDEKEMAPHDVAVKAGTAQEGPCRECPMNEFGSADKGKGKACKNTRRLALLPAGTLKDNGRKLELIDDPEHYATTPVGYMKLAVTSVKGFAAFVKQVAGTLKMPPHGIVTKVRVVSDAKTQHKVTFEPMHKLPASLIPAIMKRREEVKATIDFPYQPAEEDAKPKGKAAKGGRAAGSRRY